MMREPKYELVKRKKTHALTFTQLCEDQELSLACVRLLFTDGCGGAELDRVGMTRQLFLQRTKVRENPTKT